MIELASKLETEQEDRDRHLLHRQGSHKEREWGMLSNSSLAEAFHQDVRFTG